jgi:hypothetical protein
MLKRVGLSAAGFQTDEQSEKMRERNRDDARLGKSLQIANDTACANDEKDHRKKKRSTQVPHRFRYGRSADRCRKSVKTSSPQE